MIWPRLRGACRTSSRNFCQGTQNQTPSRRRLDVSSASATPGRRLAVAVPADVSGSRWAPSHACYSSRSWPGSCPARGLRGPVYRSPVSRQIFHRGRRGGQRRSFPTCFTTAAPRGTAVYVTAGSRAVARRHVITRYTTTRGTCRHCAACATAV